MEEYIKTGSIIGFGYVNWKRECGRRLARVERIYFGATAYHSKQQWLMEAFDLVKNVNRTFAMNDMSDIVLFGEAVKTDQNDLRKKLLEVNSGIKLVKAQERPSYIVLWMKKGSSHGDYMFTFQSEVEKVLKILEEDETVDSMFVHETTVKSQNYHKFSKILKP